MRKYLPQLFNLCALLICCSICQAQTDISIPVKGTPVLSIQAVSHTQIVYQLRLVNAEFSPQSLVEKFMEKTGIIGCQANSNIVTITTNSEIDRSHVMAVVKASGFRNTYNAYKIEYRDTLPKPEKRQETR